MFRELTYIACILGLSTFATELVFRFKPENKTTDVAYNTQSDVVLAATAAVFVVSTFILRMIDSLTAIKMKLIAVFNLGLLCTAMALRAKYEYFGSLQDTKYNLYNSTSFFLAITAIIWLPFIFFRKVTPLQDLPSIPLTETLRRRQQQSTPQRQDTATVVNRSDAIELDETLPSYYELPTPPAYTKINIPEEAATATTATDNNTFNNSTTMAATAADRFPSSSSASHENDADPRLSHFSIRSTWPRR